MLYALIANDTSFAIDLFVTRALAEAALRDVLDDEPAFSPLLSIEAIPPPWFHDPSSPLYLASYGEGDTAGR
jgi:hypothetical protein